IGKSDEMIIAAAANSTISRLEDIQAGANVAMADNRDVKLIGLRLLEAVDIDASDLNWDVTETYQAAARKVIKGEAHVAFFLAEIFHSFSRLTKTQLSVLIESDLADISHVLLVKEDFPDAQIFLEAILNLHNDADGKEALAELGMPQGFEPMSEEDAEFMIDLMQTLLD
ncbi:PhnD/SsuA/transferrin family substrate-binding protein, partial [Marinobacter sp. 1Y8]